MTQPFSLKEEACRHTGNVVKRDRAIEALCVEHDAFGGSCKNFDVGIVMRVISGVA